MAPPVEPAAPAPATGQDDLARYYSERAKARPVTSFARPIEVRPPVEIKPPAPKKPAAEKKERAAPRKRLTAIADELAAAAAAVAAAAASESGVTTTPFTVMERVAAAREQRRYTRVRLVKYALIAAAAVVVLHFAVTRVFYRNPTEEALHVHAQAIAQTVVPYYSSRLQPFQFDSAVVTLNEAVDSRHVRYAAEVTLRLRETLYVPAHTNGTAAYRQLQESLQSARAQELKFKLFDGGEAPELPELPLLIQVSHRAGDTLVVRVPFEARRNGWVWRLGPPVLVNRSVNRRIEGDALLRFEGSPYLVFENSGTLADIRARSRLARTYVIAVSKEVQKRSNVEAVADGAVPAPAGNPGDIVAVAPGEPALPAAATQVAVDPNAPPPVFDPNAPAIVVPGLSAPFDPNAPAVTLPGSAHAAPAPSPSDGLTITVPGLVEVRRPNPPPAPANESAAPKR